MEGLSPQTPKFRIPKNVDSDCETDSSMQYQSEHKKIARNSLESDSFTESNDPNLNRKKRQLRKKRSTLMDIGQNDKPCCSKTEQMEMDIDGFESQISSSEDERGPGDCEADDEQSDWVGYSNSDNEQFNPADRRARKSRQIKQELSQLEKRLERFALSKNDSEMGLEFKIKDRPNSAHLHRLLLHYRLEVVKRQRGNVVLRKKNNNCASVPELE